MKNRYIAVIAALVALGSCSDDEVYGIKDDVSVNKAVNLDASKIFQTIDGGFGASDCWSPAIIGKHWTSNRDAISEFLFSNEIRDGKPRGIGLSMWRVNMGGGSAEQGESSNIPDVSRRGESYLNDDGSYDWTRCEGQRYFLDKATQYGCSNVVLFSNTPNVQYTRNGKGYSESGKYSNLKLDKYDDFAAYMAEVAKFYIEKGYPIKYISPVNEPQYNWHWGEQEGSGWQNNEVAKITRELNTALVSRSLDVDILLSEAASWEYIYKISGDAGRSNQLAEFFDPSSSNYVGDLEKVKPILGAHSYYTDGSWDAMQNIRRDAARTASQYGTSLWQTEWSMLGDDYSSEFIGYDLATEMDIALYMSKVINNDLSIANVTSWSYWTAMDVSRWGHKNRFLLISLLPAGGVDGELAAEGSFDTARTLWVLGNYSLFIRPGYSRISLNIPYESRNFFGSAYISPDKDKIVAVYTNLSEKGVRLNEVRNNLPADVKSIYAYTTTVSKNLEETNFALDQEINLLPQSVTTIVYNLK